MDLIVQCSAPNAHSKLLRRSCEETHRRHIKGIDKVYFIEAETSRKFCSDLLCLLMSGVVSDKFVLTKDSVILLDDVRPLPYANIKGSWRSRKGPSTQAMVNTIRLLSESDATQLFDFESDAPQVFFSGDMTKTLIIFSGESLMPRTAYYNLKAIEPVRIEDPLLPAWRHDHFPSGPIVSLADTCLKSEQCRTWVRKVTKNELSTVSA